MKNVFQVSNEVKDFIFNHEKEINSDDFKKIYNLAYRELPTFSSIGELTSVFYKARIDPLVGMTEIPEGFLYSSKQRTISIPEAITIIGFRAFQYCRSLTSITIPDSVVEIASFAFWCCTRLTSVTIGNGVRSIGEWVFGECPRLTSIDFNGTKAQWDTIEKHKFWKDDFYIKVIRCTDGEISIPKEN